MNPKEVIESGLLELYALGALDSDMEIAEVEHALEVSAEARQELEKISETLRALSDAIAVDPGEDQLRLIMEQLNAETRSKLKTERPTRNIAMWRWAAAACLVLFAITATLLFRQRAENKQLASKLEQVQESLIDQQEQLDQKLQEKEELQSLVDFYSDPATKQIRMGGTPKYPDYQASIVLNKNRNRLLIQSGQLPEPVNDKQYQLWAIVDDKPVSLGVFDHSDEPVELNAAAGKIQAYAVTIEPHGGVESPTLDEMCLLASMSGS